MTALTEKVIEYGKDGKETRKLMEGIVKEILGNRERYGLANKAEADQVISDFYPRLPTLVKRFGEGERGFEPYLATSLKYFRKTEYFRNKAESEKLRAYRDWVNMELLIRADDDQSPSDGEEKPPMSPSRFFLMHAADLGRAASTESAGKRLLFLCLKCAFSLSEQQMESFGRRMGLGSGHLMARVESLRSLAATRLRRLERFCGFRDGVYARLVFAERRLHEEVDPQRVSFFDERVRRLRERLERCLERIRKSQWTPSNGEIALVLGLPKGTVDSGLHYFKRLHLGSPGSGTLSSSPCVSSSPAETATKPRKWPPSSRATRSSSRQT